MEKINDWLIDFTTAWKKHEIDKVLTLFAQDVEYWETPFDKLASFSQLKSEWEGIKNQKNIEILWEVFSMDENKYTVKWSLGYVDRNNVAKSFKGIYLIKLNSDNKCTYFFHCGESTN
ncbi:MAG: hypothetical protein WCJ51_00795 [Candidatus Moraniibacteriota bacterium]